MISRRRLFGLAKATPLIAFAPLLAVAPSMAQEQTGTCEHEPVLPPPPPQREVFRSASTGETFEVISADSWNSTVILSLTFPDGSTRSTRLCRKCGEVYWAVA